MVFSSDKTKKLELFTRPGIKSFRLLALLFLIGISIHVYDDIYLKKELKCGPSIPIESSQTTHKMERRKSRLCIFSPWVGNIGIVFMQAVATIAFFEIALQKATLDEIHDIFQVSKAINSIENIYSRRSEYRTLIEKSYESTHPGQQIRFLFPDVPDLLDEECLKTIKKQILDGCHVKILAIHPQSLLIRCLNSNDCNPRKNRIRSKLESFSEDLIELAKEISIPTLQGSLEIRLHKDLFSPVGYYSDSNKIQIMWIYFSEKNNNREHSAFYLSEKGSELSRSIVRHYDDVWSSSSGEKILLRIGEIPGSNGRNVDNIKKIFGTISISEN